MGICRVGVTGDAAFIERLRKSARVSTVMDKWALDSARIIAQEAKDLLDEGGIPSPNHVVSAPGKPANSDSREMANATNAFDLPDIGQAAVISDSDHSLPIEFGTKNMVERPVLRPATANKRKVVVALARDVINKATKR